jgi:urease accessory protein
MPYRSAHGVALAYATSEQNDPAMTVAIAPRPPIHAVPLPAAMQRARGEARLGVKADGTRTRLRENYQSGCAKIRFPKHGADAPLEAVFVNTSGGITGGDRIGYSVSVDAGASALVTTQAAERIYRRSAGVAELTTTLTVAAGGELHWLPQETILFDRSAMARTITADIADDATLLAVESVVLGRTAMAEAATDVTFHDSWRIRRGGRLVFADGLRLDGDTVATLAGGATGNGAIALATLVNIAPGAEARLDSVREALSDMPTEGGASAWNGMLTVRLMAGSGHALRETLSRVVETLRGKPMPRVWNC